MESAKKWYSSPLIIKLTPGSLGEADAKPITFTYQPIASNSGLKVKMKIAEWWSNGTEHVTETETDEQSVMGSVLQYYAKRISVEKVVIDHRDIKTVMNKKQTMLWIQEQRKLTASIIEGAESTDVEEVDTNTMVCDYDWYEKIVESFQQLSANSIYHQCSWLHWEEVLKGKDCPVMMEPLQPNKTYRLKCDHYISQHAWIRLKHPMVCPLCRGPASNPFMCGINV